MLPWQIESVVSVRGSYACPVDLASGEGLVLDLMAAMLDKGTTEQSKSEIYDRLERVGASISFSTSGDRLDFQARCLVRDLETVLALVQEQVHQPAFLEEELALVKGRTGAHLSRQASDPSYMSRNRLSRVLFDESHPHRELPLEMLAAKVAETTTDDLKRLQSRGDLFNGLRIAIVGDVEHLDPLAVADALSVTTEGDDAAFDSRNHAGAEREDATEHHIEIPDRPNLNVLFGHAVNVPTTHPDYLALWTGVFILGGNFSSRLMTTIRDEKGLTYGIRSYLSGMAASRPGAWVTGVTLSRDKLQEGLKATRAVMKQFVTGGVTSTELEERKQTMTGSYEVDLATTSGVASRLLMHMNRGWDVERIDTHPEYIAAIQTDEVNRVVGQMLDAGALSLITAGTRT